MRWDERTAGQVFCPVRWKQSLPRPLRGVISWSYSVFLLFFTGLRGLSARALRHWCLLFQDKRHKYSLLQRSPLDQRQKTNFYQITNLPNAWWYPPSTYNFTPLIAAGALPFSVAKKYQKCHRCACCYERFCEGWVCNCRTCQCGRTVIKGLCERGGEK